MKAEPLVTSPDPFSNETFIEKFSARRNQHDSVNSCVDEPAILSRMKALSPTSTLEIGCATGILTRELSRHTQDLTALDKSEKMIQQASEHCITEGVQFVCSDFLDFKAPAKFDLIISSMTLHLVKDLAAFAANAFDQLAQSGTLLITQRHPLRTANPTGAFSFDGRPAWTVDGYFTEGLREYVWLDSNVQYYHRSVGSVITTFIDAGFSVKEVAEPLPESAIETKRVVENLNSPSVLLLVFTK